MKASYQTIKKRIRNPKKARSCSARRTDVRQLYEERVKFFEKYAEYYDHVRRIARIEDTIENVLEEVKNLTNVQ